jgi:hypothetical protein
MTDRCTSVANRVLLRVLTDIAGVDSETMKTLVEYKNALVEDWEGNAPTANWAWELHRELTKMANGMDVGKRDDERRDARELIQKRMGIG